MTRRLGGNGRQSLTILATLSLAATLACGGLMGCGSSSSGSNSTVDSGPGDSSSPFDSSTDSPVDSGSDADAATPDTGPVDSGSPDVALTQLGVPTFAPPSGTADPGTVTITAPANGGTDFAANGGLILFTTNGTLPATGSATTFVYSSPIAISAATTINAIASEPGFNNSIVATASYTVTPPEAGQLLPVAFAPPAATLFPINATDPPSSLVALSSSSGATICYTLDGHTTPTCSAAGACTGTSETYNAATQVVLNGTITDPTTGNVTVEAIACAAGFQSTTPISQVYTLSVEQPTIVSPAPGNLAFPGATATLASATPFASINYTIDGTTPTCAASFPGLKIPFEGNGTSGLGGVNGRVTIGKNVTINAIGCEPGYASSGVLTAAYTVTLNAPTFPVAPANGAPGTYSAVVLTFNLGTDDAAGEWVCETTAAAAPACGATAGVCTTGTSVKLAEGSAPVPPITTTGTTVSAIGCAVGLTPSAVVQGTYTLQLAQPDLNPPGLVGGSPGTSYSIPTSQVGSLEPSIDDTSSAATFACVIKGTGIPACGVNSCTTGTFISGPFPITATASVFGTSVAAGDTWSVIACPADTSFVPSAVTTVAFSAPGTTATPSITPTTPGPYTQQLTVSIANTDTTAGTTTICYTTDGTAPACVGATCTAGTKFAPAQSGSGVLTDILLTAAGSGYVAAPNVTLSGGGGTGATATATVAAGAITKVTVTPGTGYTSAPTVTFVGGGGTGAAATAYVSDTLVFDGATLKAGPNPPKIQLDNQSVKAIACNSAETVSGIASETYNFTLAEPDVMFSGGDVNTGGTVGAGQTITVTTPSDFNPETINYTTNGTPATCATGTTIPNGGIVTVPAASPLVLSVIACGQAVTPTTPAQQPSPVRTVSFTVTAATPTITAQVPGSPTGNLTYQNTFNTVISSVTSSVLPAGPPLRTSDLLPDGRRRSDVHGRRLRRELDPGRQRRERAHYLDDPCSRRHRGRGLHDHVGSIGARHGELHAADGKRRRPAADPRHRSRADLPRFGDDRPRHQRGLHERGRSDAKRRDLLHDRRNRSAGVHGGLLAPGRAPGRRQVLQLGRRRNDDVDDHADADGDGDPPRVYVHCRLQPPGDRARHGGHYAVLQSDHAERKPRAVHCGGHFRGSRLHGLLLVRCDEPVLRREWLHRRGRQRRSHLPRRRNGDGLDHRPGRSRRVHIAVPGEVDHHMVFGRQHGADRIRMERHGVGNDDGHSGDRRLRKRRLGRLCRPDLRARRPCGGRRRRGVRNGCGVHPGYCGDLAESGPHCGDACGVHGAFELGRHAVT